MNANAESTAQGQGGAKDRAVECSGEPNSKGEFDLSSRGHGDIPGRTFRAAGPWGVASDPVTGGIIAQLIAQVEDQLGEAVECVQWYERSVDKYTRQLENLRQLQRLAEQESESQE